MSDIQGKTLEEAERFLSAIFGAVIGSITDLSKFSVDMGILLYKKHQDKMAFLKEGGETTFQKFYEVMKRGEKALSIRVDDATANDYKRFLKEQKKLFVCIDDLQTNSKIFLFREKDRKAVEKIQALVETIHYSQTEIEPKDFLNGFSNQDISTLSGLDMTAVELFRYHMKSDPALFSVVNDGEGMYSILFKPEDLKKVKHALHHANWNLQGGSRELVREQVAYRLKGRSEIALSFEDATKEFYIVSKNNPKNYIHISEKEITYYKNEHALSTVSREDPQFKEKGWDLIDCISTPALFQADEFSKNLGQRQAVLDSKPALTEFPERYLEQEEMMKYNRLMELVAVKMGMDNEHQADWGLYDTSVSYSEYNSREVMTDTDVEEQEYQRAKEREFEQMKKAYKDTEQQFVSETLFVDRNSLDYVIEKITKQREAQKHQQPEHSYEAEHEYR